MSTTLGPIRVAVIGGGCAALTTAFELTRPENAGRFEVTVYQMGWRLGGKGASGRGEADRIEEHGLHLWMGFYENAFRLMRECYAEAARDPKTCRITDWQEAFSPAPDVAVTDRVPSGGWEHWIAHFPPGRGLPGDPLDTKNPFTVRGYLQQAAMLLVELLRSAPTTRAATPVADAAAAGGASQWPSIPGPEELVGTIDRLLRFGQLATVAGLFEASELLRTGIEILFPLSSATSATADSQTPLLRLIDAIAAAAERQLKVLVDGDLELGRIWEVVDVILAILRGSVRFGLALDPRGFDAINDYDWRDWLKENGATQSSVDSGFIRGIYDLAFAFEDGDVKRPALAAGIALRGAMRMFFTYRGALFWKMHGGMGDIVFSPLYEVLKKRGVHFEFFHRLKNTKLNTKSAPTKSQVDGEATHGEASYVEELQFDVQAEIEGGGEYQPLVSVRGLPCWPAKPDFSQLKNGASLERDAWAFEAHWESRKAGEKTLHVGKDFDAVVMGVSIASIPHVCSELIERSPLWRAMVERVESVPTQAFQVWLHADREALGFSGPALNLSGFVEPFDTWADMSHLIPEESFPVAPKSIAYFCSVLPDRSPPEGPSKELAARERIRVRDNAVRFLNQDVSALWPKAVTPPSRFRFELLVDGRDHGGAEAKRQGEARFDSQYWTANVNPSDRYVLSLPGSLKHRISPLDMTFDNLTIAGDWTESGLNTGCIESAVMSGKLAAHALSGSPRIEDIIGYDHP